MELRPVTIEDCETLRAWRNDPDTRVNSNRTHAFSAEEYRHEIAGKLASGAVLLIAALDVPMGFVRIDKGTVSFMVAPEHRRKGVGRALVKAVMDRAPLTAFVKLDNEPSKRIFTALGWRVGYDEQLGQLTYRL